MHMNIMAVLVAGFVPVIVGFIWYNPKVLGNTWMRVAGLTQEELRRSNMAVVYGLSVLFSFILAFVMQILVIHQVHVQSMLMHHQEELKDTTTGLGAIFKNLMDTYGSEFRTFMHGMLHGFMSALMILLPVIATNGMFERKPWKYIWINWGYWAICFTIMGGIVSAWE